MKDTIEGNKLIAEFMGLQLTNSINQGAINVITGNPVDDSPSRLLSECAYHTSWDWLMPVVEKIVKLNKCHEGERIYLHLLIWNPELILTPLKDLKLNTTYTAVLEFINWYNTSLK